MFNFSQDKTYNTFDELYFNTKKGSIFQKVFDISSVENNTLTEKNRIHTGVSDAETDIRSAITHGLNDSISRTLSEHFADTLNLADYGVVCDGITDNAVAIQSAFTVATTSTKYANGVQIVVPFGACLSSAGVTLTYTDNRAISLSGAGINASKLEFGSGGLKVALTGTSSFEGHMFSVLNNATTYNETSIGIDIENDTAWGNDVYLSHIMVSQTSTGASFWTGVYAAGVGPQISDSYVLLNNVTDSTGSDVSLYGYPGDSTKDYADGRPSIDSKFVNVILQNSYNGILGSGHIEGIFFANGEILGNNIGVNIDGTTEPRNLTGNILFSNFHMNTHLYGFKFKSVNTVNIENALFMVFGGNSTDEYDAINASNANWYTFSHNVVNGNSYDQNDNGVVLNAMGPSTVTANVFNYTGGYAFKGTNNEMIVVNDNVTGLDPTRTANSFFTGCSGYVVCSGNSDNGRTGTTTTDTGDLNLLAPLGNVVLSPSNKVVVASNSSRSVDIELGDVNSNSAAVNVHTASTDNPYDSRWVYIGGVPGTPGKGDVSLIADVFTVPNLMLSAGGTLGANQVFNINAGSNVTYTSANQIMDSGSSIVFRKGYQTPVIEKLAPDKVSISFGAPILLSSKKKSEILSLTGTTEGTILSDSTDHVPVIYENGHWYPIQLGSVLQ